MSQTLISAAAASIKPAHATYYGKVDAKNPVILALERELKDVVEYFTKRFNSASTKTSPNEIPSRGGTLLFNIWNKYEPRWPTKLFHSRMVDMGETLFKLKAYKVALRQCYQRYLLTRFEINPYELDSNMESYQEKFYPKQQKSDEAILTTKALIGMALCEFRILEKEDPYLERDESLKACLKVLHGVRAFMQCLMSSEKYCWLQYNATIVIYEICHKLMGTGHSIKVVEYLLWAAVTMESSVPLLRIKYLEWRTTLYSAVCHAYYDSHASKHAEDFACRALNKINELSELEQMSADPENPAHKKIFRKVTHKMASLVFGRNVFESRRKPRGLLRPKVKVNLVQAAGTASWPRTDTERMLNDMFEGSAAQMEAILQALTVPHRRIFHPGEFDEEHEINEVANELFFAAKEIIAGGGGNNSSMASSADHSTLAGVRNDKSMEELAAAGECGVTLNAVVRLTKLAFAYEQWTTYNNLLDCTLIYIKKNQDLVDEATQEEFGKYEFCLALLLTVERVLRVPHNQAGAGSGRKSKSGADSGKSRSGRGSGSHGGGGRQGQDAATGEDLVNLAETVYYCIRDDPSLFEPLGRDRQAVLDRDMILDVTMVMWERCKSMFAKHQSPVAGGGRGGGDSANQAMIKSGNFGKWLHVLTIVHLSMGYLQVQVYDPHLIVQVALRLAFAFETVAKFNLAGGGEGGGGFTLRPTFSSIGTQPIVQLSNALYVVKSTYLALNQCEPRAFESDDVTQIADVAWAKDRPRRRGEGEGVAVSDSMVGELQVELFVTLCRIMLKIIDMKAKLKDISHIKQTANGYQLPDNFIDGVTEKSVSELVNCSPLCSSLLLMQKASLNLQRSDSKEAKKLLNKALKQIEAHERDEVGLYDASVAGASATSEKDGDKGGGVPPPPLLVARSGTTIVLRPPPDFHHDKLVWWRVFGRDSSGHNVKVRFNDCYLRGTGEEMSPGAGCVFKITHLRPNARYIFAVAAYTESGAVIGCGIGRSTREIVACRPMSVLGAYGHLAQAAHSARCEHLSRRACSTMWNHFVKSREGAKDDEEELIEYGLRRDVVGEASPLLIRHAMTALQIGVEAAVRKHELFCDRFCEHGGVPMPSQRARLRECERMLVAQQLAARLGDAGSHLQCIVQTYGLMTPLIQHNVKSQPFMHIGVRCCEGLKSIEPVLRSKRSAAQSESLTHMVGCLVNYVAKVAHATDHTPLAMWAVRIGRELLNPSSAAGEASGKSGGATSSKKRKSRSIQTHELTELERKFYEMGEDDGGASVAAGGGKAGSDTMTGNEDAAVVFAKLYELKTAVAFRELTKFRKRTKYLEFFVYALRRALRCGNVEVAITWSRDLLMSLHKRAEVMNVHKPLPATARKQDGFGPPLPTPGPNIPGGEHGKKDESEAKRYAAAVVEFTQASESRQGKATAVDFNSKDFAKFAAVGKKYVPYWKRKGAAAEEFSAEVEEHERQAVARLACYWLPLMRNWQKRRRLRRLTDTEMPWRADFNRLVALAHMHLYGERAEERRRLLGVRENRFAQTEHLDHDMWSLATCGRVVVDWLESAPGGRGKGGASSKSVKEAGSGEMEVEIESAARMAITNTIASRKICEGLSEMMIESISQAPHHQTRPNDIDSPSSNLSLNAMLELFRIAMLSFRRALVLAHRGRHWMVLQNTARDLHWCVHRAIQLAGDRQDPRSVGVKNIKSIACKCVATCGDLLVDMLYQLDTAHNDDDEEERYQMGEEMGGAPFTFDGRNDDTQVVDRRFVRRAVSSALQLLHVETRWEELIDVALRYLAVTSHRHAEQVAPLLAHAQHQLASRINHFGGQPHPQNHLVAAQQLRHDGDGGTKRASNHSRLQLMICKEKSAADKERQYRIDMTSFTESGRRDLYGFGKQALALASVPFDPKQTMKELGRAMEDSRYTCRSLHHSRRMLAIYLASLQHNSHSRHLSEEEEEEEGIPLTDHLSDADSMKGDGKEEERFSLAETCPTPVKKIQYKKVQLNLRHLNPMRSSTLIDSYIRTIELLKTNSFNDLTAQAANELGDIYYHHNNLSSARKWWSFSLDRATRTKDSAAQWWDSLDGEAETVERVGAWGCLHAITVAGKLGQYCASDVKGKCGYVLMSSKLAASLFQSSMPHPTRACDYATYELIPECCEQYLEILTTTDPQQHRILPPIPHNVGYAVMSGVDLFTDHHRSNLPSLLASLQWTCEQLLQLGYLVRLLPLLTLYQYVATFPARDLFRAVTCRVLRMRALTRLRRFDAASHEAINLLYGACLPHPTDTGYAPLDTYPLVSQLDCTKPFEHEDNLHILEVLAGKRISKQLSERYGPHLTCEVSVAVAALMVEIAACIPAFAQIPQPIDYQVSVAESDFKITTAKGSTKERRNSTKNSKLAPQPSLPATNAVTSAVFNTAQQLQQPQVEFIFTKRETLLTPSLFKGMLLNIAENVVVNMLLSLETSATAVVSTSPELLLVVECRLILANINRQFQLNSLAVAHAQAALRHLAHSPLFDDEAHPRPTNPYPLMEEMYRQRLGGSLWLRCRHELCLSASLEVKGLSKKSVEGSKRGGGENEDLDHSRVQVYCAEALCEAEECGDLEAQAKLLILGASLDGVTSEEAYYMLEDAVGCLNQMRALSHGGRQALAEANVGLCDVGAMVGKCGDGEDASATLRNIRKLVVIKSLHEGERADGDDNLVIPLRNPHMSHVTTLLHVNLRLAISLYQSENEMSVLMEQERLLTECENLSRLSDQHLLMSEIRYHQCKVGRLMLECGGGDLREIHAKVEGAVDAVCESQHIFSYQFARLISIEAALIQLAIADGRLTATTSSGDVDEEGGERLLWDASVCKKRAAALIHRAHHYQTMERERALLPGSSKVVEVGFSSEDANSAPDFLFADLSGARTGDLMSRPSQLDVTAATSPTHDDGDDHVTEVPSLPDLLVIDIPSVMGGLRAGAKLTWSQILYYNLLLHRKSKLTSNFSQSEHLVGGGEKTSEVRSGSAGIEVARSPLNSEDVSMRLHKLSHFMAGRLGLYEKTCAPPRDSKDLGPFVCVQYYRQHACSDQVRLVWTCVVSKGDMLRCGEKKLSSDELAALSQDVALLKQKTEEHLSRVKMIESQQQRKSPAAGGGGGKMDEQLAQHWLELVTKLSAMLRSDDDDDVVRYEEAPFATNVKNASLLAALPSTGGYFDKRNPLYPWLSSILYPRSSPSTSTTSTQSGGSGSRKS